MTTRTDRLNRASAEITSDCSPRCRIAEEDTNQFHAEHAPGCPVWHRICAEGDAREETP